MRPFDIAQSFMERAEYRSSLQQLTEAFKKATEQLGFRHFACCSHVDPLRPPRPAVVLHNYPPAWVRTYSARSLHENDPIFRYAERTFSPFSWDAAEFRTQVTAPQEEILMEAASFGLTGGYTIPIHKPWTPGVLAASCSLVPDSRYIDTRSYFAVQLMAMYLYHAAICDGFQRQASSKGALTLRERQCLELAAQGKSNWVIGQILRISQHTVHRHIEAVKQRFGVATRMQAVIGALQEGQISVGDIRARSL